MANVIYNIYTGIKTILASTTGVNTVELFNSQYDNEQRERVTKYPACYIEFANIDWQMSSHRAGRNIKKTTDIGNITHQQKGSMTIVIHIAYQTLKNESDSFAEIDVLRHNIYKALSNYEITNEQTTGLQRLRDEQDTAHDGVVVWKTTFTCSCEELAYSDSDIVDAVVEHSGAITLDVQGELDIDNNAIRTGNGK